MEETALKGAESLINVGAVGAILLLSLWGIYKLVSHMLNREKHHEIKYETLTKEHAEKYDAQRKEQMDVTMQFIRMTDDFKNTVKDMKQSEEARADKVSTALEELKFVIHRDREK